MVERLNADVEKRRVKKVEQEENKKREVIDMEEQSIV